MPQYFIESHCHMFTSADIPISGADVENNPVII
jgi:hypothetical protein